MQHNQLPFTSVRVSFKLRFVSLPHQEILTGDPVVPPCFEQFRLAPTALIEPVRRPTTAAFADLDVGST